MIVLSLNILDSSGDVRVVVKDMSDAKRLEDYVRDANKALEAWEADVEEGIKGERTTV